MSKIKDICDSLGSINVTVDKDEMVQVCLGGVAHRFKIISNSHMHEGEATLILRLIIDVDGRRKPYGDDKKCIL